MRGALPIPPGSARRPHDDRLYRPRRFVRSQYLQPGRRGRRAACQRRNCAAKYVLIGATAASSGRPVVVAFRPPDRRARGPAWRPDARRGSTGQRGEHILRSRFYSDTSDWAAFLWAVDRPGDFRTAGGGPGRKRVPEATGGAGRIAAFALSVAELPRSSRVCWCFRRWCRGWWPASRVASSDCSIARWRSARLDSNAWELAHLRPSSRARLRRPAGAGPKRRFRARGWPPHGLEWKARTLGELNARLLERAKFVDFAMRSVEDGLIIASTRRAHHLCQSQRRRRSSARHSAALVGQNLLQRLPDSSDAGMLRA